MNRFAVAVVLLASLPAFAISDEDAAQAGNKAKPNMGPTEWGDPMKISDTTVVHPTTDVVVQTSLGPFELKRTFHSNQFTWRKGQELSLLKPPYGKHPLNNDSVEWVHNLYSFVVSYQTEEVPPEPGDPAWLVRDTNGTFIDFSLGWAPSGAIALAPSSVDTSGTRLLQMFSPERYVLVRPGAGRFIYEHKVASNFSGTRDIFFLTRIEGEQYDYSANGYSPTDGTSLGPTLATITYITNTFGQKTPKIDVVSLVDGQSLKFYYNTNDTLDRIELRNKPLTSSVVVAQYSYASSRLSGVTDVSGRNEAYTYGSGGANEFMVTANGLLVTKKTLNSSAYWKTDYDDTSNRTVQVLRNTPSTTLAEPDCDPNGGGSCNNNWRTWLQTTPVFEGDGTGAQVSVETRHFYRLEKDQVTRQREVCTKSGGTCAAFADQIAYWHYLTVVGESDLSGYTDRNGINTTYSWTTPGTSATPYQANELTQIARGSSTGNPSMHALDMVYEYAGATRSALRFYEQQVKEESETSVVPGCAVASTTYYKRDPNTNYLDAVIHRGCTRPVTGAEQQGAQTRHVATFYFKHYKCEGATSATNDSLGRTLEVHGPCLVTNTSATDCNGGGIIPITQFEYWSSSETSDRAKRLKRKSTFTNNTSTTCPGTRLDTTYTSYDAFGQVLSETDPNGTMTTRSFTGQRIASETTAGGASSATKTYSYDSTTNQLTSIQLPAGNFEVFCYQTGIAANAACTGGTPSDKLMWKAISATSTGANPVERVDYTYANGQVASESYFEGGATSPTRTKRFEADPLGRPTYEQWGNGTGSYFATKRFGPEGELSLDGVPYNHPDGLCKSQSGSDKRCSEATYDRLGRLEVNRSPGIATNNSYYYYDYQSHLKEIAVAGLSLVTYEYDDFGRLIAFQGSWTGTEGGGNASKALQEFDAAGNITKRWMPGTSGSQLETWVYDSLSRVKEAWVGTTLLWNNFYDGDIGSPHANCPAVSTSKLRGRLQVKTDSFGNSWYQYDDFGNILKIRRERTGTSACSASGQESAHNTPDSEFTYTSDGRLATEKYPHGRKLEYVYGASGKQHRIVAIKAAIGSSTLSTLIQSIDYYAFGGVKTYQFATTGGATTVSNLVGDVGTGELATSCASFTPPSSAGDTTGRIRMLQVFRSSTNIFRRGYRWDADQIAEEKTCLLDDGTPTTLVYGLGSTKGYDQRLQLKNVSRPSGEFAARGGQFQQRTFSYDALGARTAIADAPYAFVEDIGTHGRLTGSRWTIPSGTTHVQAAHAYDVQGRMSSKSRFKTLPGWAQVVSPVADDGTHGSVGAVFKQMIVNGATYEYFYDSAGRRRYKSYPTGAHDEYFHHGANLIEDRGSESASAPTQAPLDEYVWLDGKPVALIKVKLNSSFAPTSDRTGTCTRVGIEDASCGVYFIVSDHLGKPVLMLDEGARVTGVGEYDSFGLVNTVTHPAETNLYGVAYSHGQNLAVATFKQPGTTYQSVRMRVRYGQVSTHDGYRPGPPSGTHDDYTQVVNSSGGVLAGPYHGFNLGAIRTPWFAVPSNGEVTVKFNSDVYSDLDLWGAPMFDGVVIDGYEYERFQAGAQPVWTALRFPGQYFDLETEFAENWNRFYDARDGRYIAPDPARVLVLDGAAVSAYAYARNNPIRHFDASGLAPLTNEQKEAVQNAIDAIGKVPGYAQYAKPLQSLLDSGKMVNKDGDIIDELLSKLGDNAKTSPLDGSITIFNFKGGEAGGLEGTLLHEYSHHIDQANSGFNAGYPFGPLSGTAFGARKNPYQADSDKWNDPKSGAWSVQYDYMQAKAYANTKTGIYRGSKVVDYLKPK